MAQWKRAGPITQRSVDRNYALLTCFGPFDASSAVKWNCSNSSFVDKRDVNCQLVGNHVHVARLQHLRSVLDVAEL